MFEPCLNVEPFFNTPFGLNRTHQKSPVSGAALMVHKLMAGEVLDDTQPTIRLVMDPLSPRAGCIMFTEQGFLEYLQAEGRAFPCTPGVRPKGVVLLAGRRSGKTSLLSDKALYDLAMSLSAPNFHDILDPGSSADYLYLTPMSGVIRRELDQKAQGTWLGNKTTTLTNSSLYYDDREAQKRSRILLRSTKSKGIRGGQYFGCYADDYAHLPNFPTRSDGIFRTLASHGSQYVFATSFTPNTKDIAFNYFNYTRDKDDYLGIALNTWELNPNVPRSVYVNSMGYQGNLNEFMPFPNGV